MIQMFLISFLASIVGAICGIGGGVIIKPVMDLFQLASISTINFLSACTVLSMSCYSVGKTLTSGEKSVNTKTATPLAIGAAVGGILGKQLFQVIRSLFENQNRVGAVQALCLAIVTIGTLVYTLNKDRIATKQIKNAWVCILVGFVLGIISSFLGIGGGPINLVVLYYFFDMDTKTAAGNSLYIILFSQLASVLSSIILKNVPPFQINSLVLMVLGGIGGGMAGRKINKRLNNKAVEKMFIFLMILIIVISVYNMLRGMMS